MSCHEWERGTIKIPSKEWAAFRTGVLKCWNDEQLKVLAAARALHGALKKASKGKRGKNRSEALRKALGNCHYDLQHLVVDVDYRQGHLHTLKGLPKKKDLKFYPTSKDATLHCSDATIVLCNKNRTVTWDVGENNHAREHARATFIGVELFRRLGQITWTRGSGGELIGNDEYNRDAGYDHAGGGGSYVTATYSATAQKQEREARKRERQYGGYLAGLPFR